MICVFIREKKTNLFIGVHLTCLPGHHHELMIMALPPCVGLTMDYQHEIAGLEGDVLQRDRGLLAGRRLAMRVFKTTWND